MTHRFHRATRIATCLAVARLLAVTVRAEPEPAAGPVRFEQLKPALTQYCSGCHNADKHKGDLNLLPYLERANVASDREVWEKVAEQVESRDMPPSKAKEQLNEDIREALVKFIDGHLSVVDCTGPKNPGRVTIRRLNREEYHNTIRDLVKVDYWPEDFPNDEVGYGFDNIGDVLSLSPMLMEKYLAAAEMIVGKAIKADAVPKPFSVRIGGDKFTSGTSGVEPKENGTLEFSCEGEGRAQFTAPRGGEYLLRIHAYGDQAGPEAPKMKVIVGERELQTFAVPNVKDAIFDVKAKLEPGQQTIRVAFLNDYYSPDNPDPKLRGDRNLYVNAVEISGPPGAASDLPESHRQIIARMPQPGEEHAVARELLGKFARQAYRRPLADGEAERLARFVDLAMGKGGTFLEGMQVAVQAALCSPHFLYRWELDPREIKPGDVRELNDVELASRLSYFIWNSMPDSDLLALAERGELRKDGNLQKQVTRMLGDWRARSFTDSFVNQWLQIRGIWEVAIDPGIFPGWDESLKGMMKEETELFFRAIATENRPIADLLDADFTFLNEKLARHYGIAGVTGKKFQRVSLPKDSPRGGVLTLGSVLVSTSTPTRTSPVIRGKWILEQIIGTPPPVPPPDVPPLQEQTAVNQTASLRKRFEEHRSRAECASCHKRLDPLGFALENFDATGKWRDMDGKFPIDSTGKLPNGTAFGGARDLKTVLKANDKFVRGFTEKLMTYALGRGLDAADRCAVDEVIAKAGGKNASFAALVNEIVKSEPFLKRKTAEVVAR